MVALLHGRIECVHVNVNDFAQVCHDLVVIHSFIAFLWVQDPWVTYASRIALLPLKYGI
jgi:hypothetical protein